MSTADASQPPVGDLRAEAARALADALSGGDLRHPNRPEAALFIPGLVTTGHANKQLVDAINATAKMLGEAALDTVLTKLDAELIGNAELQELRTTAANQPDRTVTVTCRHGDLIHLAVKPGTNTAKVNCTRLRRGLRACTGETDNQTDK